MRIAAPFLLTALSMACTSSPTAPPATGGPSPASATSPGAATVTGTAALGQPAPDFSLPSLSGETVALGDLAGKTVVLEWFNPDCPFVNLAHEKGSLKGMGNRHAKEGVAWLAINSGGPGRQGHGADTNHEGQKRFGMDYPILIDENGAVGHAYGAERTPHLFVIDGSGTLVYDGAIDNSPDAEGESPAGGKLVNYVDGALADVAAGRPVATPSTEPYGCTVKYAN